MYWDYGSWWVFGTFTWCGIAIEIDQGGQVYQGMLILQIGTKLSTCPRVRKKTILFHENHCH